MRATSGLALALVVLVVILFPSAACSGRDGLIRSFTAERSTVTKGQGAKLTAVFEGTGTIDNDVGDVTSGVEVTTPELTGKTKFTLTALNDVGASSTRSIDINVIDPAVFSFTSEQRP